MFKKILKEKGYIANDSELKRLEDAHYKYGEQVDNLIILISTGALLLTINLVYQGNLERNDFLELCWLAFGSAILLSLYNRFFTQFKCSVMLEKIYEAKQKKQDIYFRNSVLDYFENLTFYLSLSLITIGFILLAIVII